jgi:molybdopterin-guanine dinucleotide biosynthesis protein B
MIACSIIGYKNSGKTTFIVKLVEELKKLGKTVAVVKHAGHFDEPDGVDTARFKQVADMVLGLGMEETFVSWPKERSLLSLLPLVKADVLLVEGGKKLGYLPRIVLLRPDDGETDADELSRGLAIHTARREQADPAKLAKLILDKCFLLPGLGCGACGRKGCTLLARDILSGNGDIAECRVLSEDAVSIRIDGKTLAVNPFVGQFLAAGLKGMLGQLKGFTPGKIEITVKEE